MGAAVVSAALLYTHEMAFPFEAGRTYDVQNNGSMITVRNDEGHTVLYEWIPYTCLPNPYAVKTLDENIVLTFTCKESIVDLAEYDGEDDIVTV